MPGEMSEVETKVFATKLVAAHGSDIEAEASAFGQCSRTLHCDIPEPPPQCSQHCLHCP